MQNKFIEIKTTFKSLKVAKEICKNLVESRLVACGHITKISSMYCYEGKFESQNEILLILKTKKTLYHKIKKAIIEKHEYNTPQIISQLIDDGSSSYLEWIDSCLIE